MYQGNGILKGRKKCLLTELTLFVGKLYPNQLPVLIPTSPLPIAKGLLPSEVSFRQGGLISFTGAWVACSTRVVDASCTLWCEQAAMRVFAGYRW